MKRGFSLAEPVFRNLHIDERRKMDYDEPQKCIWKRLWGRVQFPTDGTVHEPPPLAAGRSGAIPEPTVKVRMGEDETPLRPCMLPVLLGRADSPCLLMVFPEAVF